MGRACSCYKCLIIGRRTILKWILKKQELLESPCECGNELFFENMNSNNITVKILYTFKVKKSLHSEIAEYKCPHRIQI